MLEMTTTGGQVLMLGGVGLGPESQCPPLARAERLRLGDWRPR